MRKFFRKIGRFLKKIWESIKKAIAILIMIALVVLICYTFTVIVKAILAKSFAPLTQAFGAVKFSGWATASVIGQKTAWLAGHQLWVYAVGLVGVMTVAHMTMPNTMSWAARRTMTGLKYAGDTAVQALGSIGSGVARGTVSLFKGPLAIAALVVGGVFLWSRRNPATVMVTGGAK